MVRLASAVLFVTVLVVQLVAQDRPRAREIGVAPGVLPTGPLNAIADVSGVRVGQVSLIEGDTVWTGVTAILPHGGNLFQEKVPAAIHMGNAFGKLIGYSHIDELGVLESVSIQ